MRSITAKFYILVIVVIAAISSGLYVQYTYSRSMVYENAQKVADASVSALTEQIDGWLAAKAKVIDNAGDFIGVQIWDDKETLAFLKVLLKNNPAFASIYFVTTENQMINASGWKPPPGFELRKRPWYVTALVKNKLIYTEAFVNASKDDLVVTIAKPVLSSEGMLLGVVAGDVSVRTVISLVKDIKVGEQGFSFLVDGNNKMLAYPDMEEVDGILGNLTSQRLSGVVDFKMKDREGFVAYRQVKDTSWILGSYVSTEEFIKKDEQLQRGFGLALTVSIIILIALFTLLARLVIAPLLRLNASVRKINMETSPEYRIVVTGNDEIAMLGRTINKILGQAEENLAQRNANEAAIKMREETLQSIIRGTNVGTWEWNVKTGETVYNERWAEIIGYTLAELQPVSIETWKKLAHPDDLVESNRLLQEHLAGKSDFYRCDSRMRHKNGSWVWVFDCGQVLAWDEDGSPLKMMGTHTDISERKQTEQEVLYLSYHDQLTGLYNRRFYEEEVKRLDTKRNLPLTIIMGDVNGLKRINDTLGHTKGDELIKKAAWSIVQACRADDIVARVGGDEFVILLPKTADAEAEDIILRVQELAAGETVDSRAVSISFGAATKTFETEDAQIIFQKAEKIMYKNKHEDRLKQRKRKPYNSTSDL